jgi:hypothetical protein
MSALPNARPALVRRIHVASALFAVILVAILVMRASTAAFTATTENPDSFFTADSINLVDNDAGAALFEVEGMVPGQDEEACITVTYESSSAVADVRLYGDIAGVADLAPYLDLTVQYQNDATNTFSDCTGFAASGTAYSGTVAGFLAAHTNWDSSAATQWSDAEGDDTRVYRFAVALQDDEEN